MDPAHSVAAETPRPSAWREFIRNLLLYVDVRLRLLRLESREAGSHLVVLLVALVLGIGCVATAWLIAMPALIWLVAEKVGWHWHRVALAAAALHLLVALIALTFFKTKLRRLKVFEETLNQFQKDRDCLTPKP